MVPAFPEKEIAELHGHNRAVTTTTTTTYIQRTLSSSIIKSLFCRYQQTRPVVIEKGFTFADRDTCASRRCLVPTSTRPLGALFDAHWFPQFLETIMEVAVLANRFLTKGLGTGHWRRVMRDRCNSTGSKADLSNESRHARKAGSWTEWINRHTISKNT
jgi:hypothetical protein